MPDPFTLFCLILCTFALAYMGSTPDIDGPVYVFAILRAVMTKIGKAIPGGWGGWMVTAATCIVCWSPWCALAVVSVFYPGLPPRELVLTVLTISGAVIAADRWLDRATNPAMKAPCKGCGQKAAATQSDRPTTTKKADAQAASPETATGKGWVAG